MENPGQFDQPTAYQIRLQGKLDLTWSAWFPGLAITHVDGDTLLAGIVADQAALHGVLAKIRDLGLPIQSIISCESK